MVAAEVRKLAERSRTAAKEIGELAARSAGVAEHSGQLVAELLAASARTAERVREVSATSRQAAGVGQLSKAMSVVDQVTQRNASAAEAPPPRRSSRHADALRDRLAFFVTDDEDAPAPPRGAATCRSPR